MSPDFIEEPLYPDTPIFIWKLENNMIEYLTGPCETSEPMSEEQLDAVIESYNISNNNMLDNAIRLPNTTIDTLPLDSDRRFWRWDESQQKVVVDSNVVNSEEWVKIRAYRSYLLQYSDGLAIGLVTRKMSGEASAELDNDISTMNDYKHVLRNIPETYETIDDVIFPDPVLGITPMSKEEFEEGGS